MSNDFSRRSRSLFCKKLRRSRPSDEARSDWLIAKRHVTRTPLMGEQLELNPDGLTQSQFDRLSEIAHRASGSTPDQLLSDAQQHLEQTRATHATNRMINLRLATAITPHWINHIFILKARFQVMNISYAVTIPTKTAGVGICFLRANLLSTRTATSIVAQFFPLR